MSEPISIAIEAARAAGNQLLSFVGKKFHIQQKESYNLCSEADLAANTCIINALHKAFPSHSILSEETEREDGDLDHLWVIDPLDATNNFVHGLPQYAVSIAYYYKGQAQVGVVYQPAVNQLFTAERGKGSFLNEKRVRCSTVETLDKALIGVGFYYDRGLMMERTLDAIKQLFHQQIHGIRRFGCASVDLCYIGCGSLDAFFEFELSPWDFAAARLFVEEAGGQVSSCTGEDIALEKSSFLASNSVLHASMLEIVRPHLPT